MGKYDIYQNMQFNPFLSQGQRMSIYKFWNKKIFWTAPKKESELSKLTGKEEEENPYEDWKADEIDMLIKYIVLFIDPESPHSEDRNLDIRSKKCIDVLGLRKDIWERVLEEIENRDVWYSLITTTFFKYANDHKYETWFSLKLNYHTLLEYARSGIIQDKSGSVSADINARAKLSLQLNEMLTDLVELEYELFPDERLKKMITDNAMDDSLGGHAERYAKEPKYNR